MFDAEYWAGLSGLESRVLECYTLDCHHYAGWPSASRNPNLVSSSEAMYTHPVTRPSRCDQFENRTRVSTQMPDDEYVNVGDAGGYIYSTIRRENLVELAENGGTSTSPTSSERVNV